MRANPLILFCLAISSAIAANAQLGIRGQIFLPNGEPLHRTIRYTLATDDGARTEVLFTDSNGRIEVNQPVNVPYSITVQGDGETYDTTTVRFDPAYSGKYITLHLRRFTPPASFKPGVVDASNADQRVSPKAKEAYESALKLIQAREYEKAIEPLNRAISLAPDYFQAYNDLGVLYIKLNKFEPAADALRHAIKINDKMYLPQLNLGIALNHLGQYKEAADVLTRLQRGNDGLAEKINPPLVEALIGAQQWARAEEELKKGLLLKDADTVDVKLKLGMVMLKQNKSERAVSVLREAILIEPDNALAQFNLGAALMQSGSLDDAEKALRRACELKPSGMPGAQLLLGEVYFQKKNYPLAIEAFKTYLRELPDAPNASQVKEAIDRLSRALNKH